jgi:hypothetical protein
MIDFFHADGGGLPRNELQRYLSLFFFESVNFQKMGDECRTVKEEKYYFVLYISPLLKIWIILTFYEKSNL